MVPAANVGRGTSTGVNRMVVGVYMLWSYFFPSVYFTTCLWHLQRSAARVRVRACIGRSYGAHCASHTLAAVELSCSLVGVVRWSVRRRCE